MGHDPAWVGLGVAGQGITALGAAEQIQDRVQNSQAAITGQRQWFPSPRYEIPFCERFGDNQSFIKYKIKFPFFQAKTVFQIHQLCFLKFYRRETRFGISIIVPKVTANLKKSQFSKGAFPLGSASGINPRERSASRERKIEILYKTWPRITIWVGPVGSFSKRNTTFLWKTNFVEGKTSLILNATPCRGWARGQGAREAAGKAAQGTSCSGTEAEPGLTMLIFQMGKKPFPIPVPCAGRAGDAPSPGGLPWTGTQWDGCDFKQINKTCGCFPAVPPPPVQPGLHLPWSFPNACLGEKRTPRPLWWLQGAAPRPLPAPQTPHVASGPKKIICNSHPAHLITTRSLQDGASQSPAAAEPWLRGARIHFNKAGKEKNEFALRFCSLGTEKGEHVAGQGGEI